MPRETRQPPPAGWKSTEEVARLASGPCNRKGSRQAVKWVLKRVKKVKLAPKENYCYDYRGGYYWSPAAQKKILAGTMKGPGRPAVNRSERRSTKED